MMYLYLKAGNSDLLFETAAGVACVLMYFAFLYDIGSQNIAGVVVTLWLFWWLRYYVYSRSDHG